MYYRKPRLCCYVPALKSWQAGYSLHIEQSTGARIRIAMKPRIAIPIPTSRDLAYNQRAWPLFEAAIAQSGGEPVEVPLALPQKELIDLLATCDGVVLPGSPADVDPNLYGAQIDPATNPADPAREAVDYALLNDAAKHGKPILGICFGVQSMNVWRGGTLIQDLTPLPVNHEAGSKVAVAHTALIAENTLLASIIDKTEAPESENYLRLPINTSHHQAIGAPGEGLRIVARCPDDGVIEAVELDPHSEFQNPKLLHVEHSDSHPDRKPQFLLGVQWHPERSYDISATSRALFARLVEEATLFANSRLAATK
jgi:putative glutamine amidotransferase